MKEMAFPILSNLDGLDEWFQGEGRSEWERIGFTGLKGSSGPYLLSHWKSKGRGPLLIIVPTLEAGESFLQDLRFFAPETAGRFVLFPPWETLPYDEIPPHPEIVRERMACLFSLHQNEGVTIVSPVQALMQKVLSPRDLRASTFSLSAETELVREKLIDFLEKNGYLSERIVEERGDFSVRGAIIDIFSPLYKEPLRIEFDGDRLVSIRRFETATQRSLPGSTMGHAILLPAKDAPSDPQSPTLSSLFDYLTRSGVIFIQDGEEVKKETESFCSLVQEHYERARKKRRLVLSPDSLYLDSRQFSASLERFQSVFLEEGPLAPPGTQEVLPFPVESNEEIRREITTALSFDKNPSITPPFSVLMKRIHEWREKEIQVFIVSHASGQIERIQEILSHYGMKSYSEPGGFPISLQRPRNGPILLSGSLSAGFQNLQEKWVLVTEEEIFGEKKRLRDGRGQTRRSSGSRRSGHVLLSSAAELQENNLIVHVDYGVGVYRGLKHLVIGGVSNDYLLLEYLDGDKVYVPVDRLNLIQRYAGGDESSCRLDKLGSTSWQKKKKRVKAAVDEMIKDLLDLYAVRQAFKGHSFPPMDEAYREFEATFEYEETPDQLRAIAEVMGDLSHPKPMDRLICGDVGYGKTEVAIRASYRVVMSGKQVAILVPTTVLAQQHFQTFQNRFRTYPVVVEVLSRFKTPQEQKAVIRRLQEGKVDVVIGTHRLLQKDVTFRDLGLVIIDEEHRFGVIHKERLKQMRKLVHVITLTATPIPRTLQMAISGIRDLSLIQTPPEDRLSIRTFVIRYDDGAVRDAVQREIRRGGQVFFVHHRVQTIDAVAHHLKKLVPEASLAVAHGQMGERELERIMLGFVRHEYNILVCTSIIESGLDIPTANTILINHAERFGLADLYQLRGRVGRGSHQAYAYLLIPGDLVLSRDAMKRIRAIQELSELGSGFRLAVEDLEIRGGGHLLGPSQSGHIAAVGFEFYAQMIERAVKELRGEQIAEEITPEIRFHLPAFIPETYVKDSVDRLNLYRRLSLCRSNEEVEGIREELIDRFGRIPWEAIHLLEVIKVKILLTKLSIKKLEQTPDQIILTFDESTRVSPQKMVAMVRDGKDQYRLTPDSRLIIRSGPDVKKDPLEATQKLLQALT
jgi:transcription-repair coupling factor (superfamily II helicase)